MNRKFNQFIKAWRNEAGLTLEEVAKKTNLTPQAISLYENEKRNVTFELLQLFANVFNKEIMISSCDKGIPMTEIQRNKVRYICKRGGKNYQIYKQLKQLFNITEEEIQAGKLFDDMTMDEYIRYSPVKKENEQCINIHKHEVLFYYYCQGAEFILENGEIKDVVLPNTIPDFVPPKRISADRFIPEQRRLLLPLLKECFSFDASESGNEISFYDLKRLKKEIGF